MEKLNFFEKYPDINPDVIIAVAKCNLLELMMALSLVFGLIYLGNMFHKKKISLKNQKLIVALICVGVVLTMSIAGALTIAATFR